MFKGFGGEGRVLSLIVEGEAPGCFAPALRFRVTPEGAVTSELADQVGADVAKDGKREVLIKIVAALASLPYDILWQRDVKVQRLRVASYAGVAVTAIAAGVGLYSTMHMRGEFARIAEKIESQAPAQQESIKKLNILVLDAAGTGAPSVKAIAEIRDILRPGNPEIDAIDAEKLPKLVQRIVEDLQKPGARLEDFIGAVIPFRTGAGADCRTQIGRCGENTRYGIAKAEAEDQSRAKERAALLGERGRAANLQLRYREAAGFYDKAAEATVFRFEAFLALRH